MKRRAHNKKFVSVARARFWDGSLSVLTLIALASFLLLFSTFYPSSTDKLRIHAVDLMSPMVEAVSAPFQHLVVTVRGVTGITALQEKMAALEAENNRLREWYQLAQTLEAENASLRDLLNVKVDPARSAITARVLSDSGMTFVKSLMINAGDWDGVQKNNAVLSGQGLIGRVIENGQSASRVLLVTDVNSRIPVLLEGVEQHAILAGENSATPYLDHIETDMEIAEGTRVITSGYGGIFPAGLPIGKVVKTESGYAVDLYADFTQIRFVRVISEAKDTNLKPASESAN